MKARAHTPRGARGLAAARLLVLLGVLSTASLAFGRVGGGEHYAGDRSEREDKGSFSGSSGSGGFDLSGLFVLALEYPQIGIPVVLVALGFWGYTRMRARREGGSRLPPESPPRDEDGPHVRPGPAPARSGPAAGQGPEVRWVIGVGRVRSDGSESGPPAFEARGPRQVLASLREGDPDFSLVTFQDYLYALYGAAHEARGVRSKSVKMAELSPFLAAPAREALSTLGQPDQVRGVIVGAMCFASAERRAGERPQVHVAVEFQANYTEEIAGRAQTYFAVEQWRLVRDAQARSRPPEKVRVFLCPSCGAPLSAVRGRTCSYCRQVVDTGEFDWVVTAISSRREPRPGLFTSGGVEEEGTRLPTRFAPDLRAVLRALQAQDPAFSEQAFRARAELVFVELQQAWSTRDWSKARPFVSDQLFQFLSSWIDAYQQARLRNVIEEAQVLGIEFCRVERDRWYDAITVRVSASMIDCTVDERGEVKSGSRTRPRVFTEYWTFIRGAQVKGAARAEKCCPQCGGPLDIDMAGQCQHCRAKVTSGEFDWVLSLIEQDEAYRG